MVTGVEVLQLLEGERIDASRAASDAVDTAVVEDNHDVVGSGLHVEFQRVDAQINGPAVAVQRVFGPLPPATTMGDDLCCRVFSPGRPREIGMWKGHRGRQQGEKGPGDEQAGSCYHQPASPCHGEGASGALLRAP